jgi:hypothetical protein
VRAGPPLIWIALLATSVQATPSPYSWRREVLLGANEREHLYLVFQHSNPGANFAAFDSIFVYERNNTDPRWQQRTLLRATAHTVDPSSGEKKDIEAFIATFDLPQFLIDHNCQAAFFDPAPDSLAIDENGMYYHERGARSYVLTDAEMRIWTNLDLPQLGPRGERRRVLGIYQTDAVPDSDSGPIDYVLVRSGAGMDDGGQIEAIVPVPQSKLNQAVGNVKKKIAGARKPGSAHK